MKSSQAADIFMVLNPHQQDSQSFPQPKVLLCVLVKQFFSRKIFLEHLEMFERLPCDPLCTLIVHGAVLVDVKSLTAVSLHLFYLLL